MENDGKIPQITPPAQKTAGAVPEKESILIPKIEVKEELASKMPETSIVPPKRKFPKTLGIGLGVLALILIYLSLSFLSIYKKGKDLYKAGQDLNTQVTNQNLEGIKGELKEAEVSLTKFRGSLKLISWMKVLPFAGSYVKDIDHGTKAGAELIKTAEVLVVAIEPYADVIGFGPGKDESGGDGAKTTQERIDFIVQSIPSLIPKADEISKSMAIVQTEVSQINPDRYPKKLGDKELRSKLKEGLDLIDEIARLAVSGKPLLTSAPYLLGIESPRTYLVLFQNDKELRPTGGFLTAYAVMKVSKGKVEPVSSNDIYNLDSGYKPTVAAPEEIIKYLKGPYLISRNLRLRDMNWSPDFSESMSLFTQEASKVGLKGIDGVIAVDTQFLVNLLAVLGPIGVSGYGNFSTDIVAECNCPQVIFELESFADIEGPIVWSENEPGKIVFAPANYDNRKKIIGPLMNSILANAMGQPKDKLPALFEAGFQSLAEKHVLFYIFEESAQKAIEDFQIGGKISQVEGDYLHINDANLGGRKSNLYVTQEVSQEVSIGKDGSVEKTLTITYKNPAPYDGWLNSVLPNWVRVYVPKGSALTSSEGLEDKKEPYEELGKTVFSGLFELRPQGVAKVTFTYKLPFKVNKEYVLFIEKQPGTGNPLYLLKVGKKEEEFFLRKDKLFKSDL